MSGVKQKLRRLIPQSIFRKLLPLWHLLRAITAAAMYGFPAKRMKVIGITGTNGKTTTASYVASILEAAGYKVGVSSTAYYKIGDKIKANNTNMTVTDPFKVNRLLLRMRLARVDYVILEVTSHALQQKRVWGIPFYAAVMTNLTQDHLDYHGSMESYAQAKARLFKKAPPVIVLNRDDEWFDFFNEFAAERDKITYGTSEQADSRITKARMDASGSDFNLIVDTNNLFELHTDLAGRFNVYNAAAAASLAYVMHIKRRHIMKGIADLKAVPGRMESLSIDKPYQVVVDYAHTPDALQNVLETLQALTANRLILVFGATGDRDKTKRPIMGEIAAKHADRIFVTDEEPYSEDPAKIRKDVMQGIEKAKGGGKSKDVADRREGIKQALNIARKGDTVLITGMGHQEFMKVGDKKLPWNDARVVEELISEK